MIKKREKDRAVIDDGDMTAQPARLWTTFRLCVLSNRPVRLWHTPSFRPIDRWKKNKPLSVLILYSKKYWHDLDFLEWTNQSRLIDCQVRANNTSSIIITVNSRKKRSSFDGGTARMSISRSYLEWLIQARKWRKKKLLPAVEGIAKHFETRLTLVNVCVCVYNFALLLLVTHLVETDWLTCFLRYWFDGFVWSVYFS